MESRSPRGIIPVSKNVVQMMQSRLEEVEDSATQLTREILTARQDGSTDRFSVLLSKTQSMESVLQSLKLNFVNLSTLTRQPSDLEQKLVEMTDIYTEEMKKLSSENAHLKADKQEMNEKRQQIEIELQRVKISVEELSHAQVGREETITAERKRSESLLRKVAEVDRQLTEERQLRFALDRANSELGQRLDEMESMLKQEHLETQNFTGDFIKLKKDFTKKCEELKQEKGKQREMEGELITVCKELDKKLSELDLLKKEKNKVTSEMGTVHEKYGQLNSQLEAMQNLFVEYQKEKADVEADCVKLNSKLDEVNSENLRLTQELVRAQNNDESARLIDTRQELRHMTKERDQLLSDNKVLTERVEELEETCQELDKELSEIKENANKEAESKYAVIGGLQERLANLKSELLSLEGDKETLLSEVNGAVDAMDGERNTLQGEIESYQEQLAMAVNDLEEEKNKSRELEQKLQSAQAKPDFTTQFERRLTELAGQKNALSYENGKLQSQVEQLQNDLESIKEDQKNFNKVNKKLSQAENKIKKLKHELDSCKQTLAQAELMSQQLHTTSEMRETDYNSAIRSRDEALRDAKLLAARVESLEEAIQQQEELRSEVEEKLREDNSKVAESLENMMALHTELQCKHESVQIELGKKDTQLNEFKRERKKQQDKLARLENQLETACDKLSVVEGKQTSQTKNLEREVKSVKMDNSKLVRTLQDTLELNEQLRAQVSILEETLGKQRSESDKLSMKSNELETKMRQQESSHAARISELEALVSQERNKAYQRMEEQLKTVQKETESILERNSDLLQQNSSLKSEMSKLTSTNDNLGHKLDHLQEQLGQLKDELKHKNKQTTRAKGLEEDLEKLQATNHELSSRCKGQQKTINKFVSQFKELQQEMKQLAVLHAEQNEVLSEKDRLLQTEELRSAELRAQYHECKRQVAALQALQKDTETKLMEANNDSQIATETLEDTNRYFKERFSALAGELSSAKRQHLDLEWRNLEKHHRLTLEQKKLEDTTSKARDMIKASRHQLTNIADKTEFDSSMREGESHYTKGVSTLRSPDHTNMTLDTSVEDILSISQQRTPHRHNKRHTRSKSLQQTVSTSPFSSSSQKLDAIINEMEKRRLIC